MLGRKWQLRHLPTPDELALDAATELHGVLARRGGDVPFGIALSGGRIAAKFYDALAGILRSNPGLLRNVHFFWADERCVPPTDSENSYAIAQQHLFEPLSISTEFIHRIRGEVDREYAVREAEAELCRIMPLNGDGQPVLDLIILGMGEDGHVASLFPGEPAASVKSADIYRHVHAAKPPPERVTLGYAPIKAAKEVWVLVSGSGKAETFRKFLARDSSLPVSRIAQNREQGVVFQDIAESAEFL